MVAVAEICGSHACLGSGLGVMARSESWQFFGLQSLAVAVATACGAIPFIVHANPTGGVAIVGAAQMSAVGNKLTVTTQNGAGQGHSAIDWQTFSIPKGNTTYFAQPSVASTVINRVVTQTPSQIFGTLGSNGHLVLVNQSGITVGAGAVVDTAGFTASALRMTDADALAGRMRFGDGSADAAGVSVLGNILARSGDVVILGTTVDTGKDALIQSANGSTILAAGRQIEITGRGLEGISLQVQAPSDQAINLGTLQGDAVGLFAGTLKHSGLIQATTASLEGGRVVLRAAGDTYVEGTGHIVATGIKGGSVDVLGSRVAVTDQAVIDASGEQTGGLVRVGGDYQGKNTNIPNASVTYFGPRACIKADATKQGDGGRVIVWADDTTRSYGSISARGGSNGGDGGFVETSGHNYLDVNGILGVDTQAPNGNKGKWLLDPDSITLIAGAGTDTMTGTLPLLTSGGTNSTIYGANIKTYLGTSNVILSTGTAGTGSIAFTAGTYDFSPTNAATSSLSLLANGSGASTGNISLPSGTNITMLYGGLTLVAGWDGVSTSLPDTVAVATNKDVSVIGASSISAASVTMKAANDILITPASSDIALTSSAGGISLAAGGAINGLNGAFGVNLTAKMGGGVQVAASAGDISLNSIKTGGLIATDFGGNNALTSGSVTVSAPNGAVNLYRGISTVLSHPDVSSSLTDTGSVTITGKNNISVGAIVETSQILGGYANPNSKYVGNAGGVSIHSTSGALNLFHVQSSVMTYQTGTVSGHGGDINLSAGTSIAVNGNLDSFVSNNNDDTSIGRGGNVSLDAGTGITVGGVVNASSKTGWLMQATHLNSTGGGGRCIADCPKRRYHPDWRCRYVFRRYG